MNMGAGLKISFLTAVFGSVTFILPRIGISENKLHHGLNGRMVKLN